MASRAEGERSRESLSPPPPPTQRAPPSAPPSIPKPAPLLPLPSRRLSSNFSSYFNRPPNLRSRKEPGRGGGRGEEVRKRSAAGVAPAPALRCARFLLLPFSRLSPHPHPTPTSWKAPRPGMHMDQRAAPAETGRGSAHAHTGSIALLTPPPTCCGARPAGQQLQSRCAVALRLSPILKPRSLTESGWAGRRLQKRSRG